MHRSWYNTLEDLQSANGIGQIGVRTSERLNEGLHGAGHVLQQVQLNVKSPFKVVGNVG